MAIKPSAALYEAEMFGDKASADKIRNEISDMQVKIKKPVENIISFNTVLNNEKSSAVSVYDFLNKSFGDDWWEWEIETLDHMLWIKYSIALEGPNRDKVLAIRHLCNSDRAFFDWYEFNQLALSFSGSMADFECLKQPSPGMIVNTIKTMRYIRPDRENAFGKEVTKFICITMINNGVYSPAPSILDIVLDVFKPMVSEEMVGLWPKILEKYSKIVKKVDSSIEENIVDIQARRIFSAEASSVSYSLARVE